jgi:predicted alpha/beta superfamily hydrolase
VVRSSKTDPRPLRHAGGWADYVGPGQERHPTVEGDIKRLAGLWSPQLENRRDILVYLPRSYEGGRSRYPVLYMHDGQNLFDPATSFSGEWHVDGTMEMLGRRGIEAVVVAIPNMGEERLDEYSPFVDPRQGGGRGDAYLEFIIDTIKPRIDRDFRTLADREHTCIAGSSMGGLISLYAFFRRPDVFGVAGVLSPALWFAGGTIFDFVAEAPYARGKIYLDIGTREGERTLADVRRMRDLLIAKGYRLRKDLFYVEERGAGHDEGAWRRRIRFAVPFFLRRVHRLV